MESRRSRRKRSYKRVFAVTAVLVALLLGAAAYMYLGMGLQRKKPAAADLMATDATVQVMIMGVDHRAEDIGRSDTLMVLSVDTAKEKASILSIPRDTRVRIEGNGYDKINHAYAFGGHELTKKTVESLLGVPMDYYVMIDVHAFERIIDAIGGVDIIVEKRMHYEDPWDDDGGLVIDLYPGEQHLDGERAMEYVRYRDEEGDIGRIERQQRFMRAVLEQVASPQILPKLPGILDEIKAAVKTDLSTGEMLRFVHMLKRVHDNGLASSMLPGKPAFFQEISYWLPDIKAVRQQLAAAMGLTMTDAMKKRMDEAALTYAAELPKGLEVVDGTVLTKPEAAKAEQAKTPLKPGDISVLVVNSSGINGAGAEAAGILRRKGFVISAVETGKTSAREQTTITTAAENVELFYGMPFQCVIMEGGERKQAVLNIGRDYKK